MVKKIFHSDEAKLLAGVLVSAATLMGVLFIGVLVNAEGNERVSLEVLKVGAFILAGGVVGGLALSALCYFSDFMSWLALRLTGDRESAMRYYFPLVIAIIAFWCIAYPDSDDMPVLTGSTSVEALFGVFTIFVLPSVMSIWFCWMRMRYDH